MVGHFRISGKTFKRSSWALLALGGLMVFTIWANLLWTYRDIEAKTLQDLETHLTNLTEALRLQTDSVLRGVDTVAIQMRREYQTRSGKSFDADTQRFINRAMEGFAVQVVMVDARGMLAWSSEPASFPMNLTDRRYFSVHAETPETDTLFIGTPILNRINHRWIIPVSRPLIRYSSNDNPKTFNGVIMISLDPEHFADLLRRVDLGKSGVISILASKDGSYLVRSTQDNSWVGKKIEEQTPLLKKNSPDKGVFRQVSSHDGIERLHAYQHLPEYGITLVAGLSIHEALAPIQHNARNSYTVAFLVTITISALFIYLFQLLRRHAETEAQLETEHRVLREAERIGMVGSWEWDLDTKQFIGSEQFHRMFCLEGTWGAISPEHLQQHIHEDDRKHVQEAMREAGKTGKALHDLEYRIICPDGSIRIALACGEHQKNGTQRQMIGTLLDVTTLRASQKQLLQAQIVFDNAQEAVVVSDAKSIIQTVNPAFERITGYTRQEAVGLKTNLLASGRHPPEFYAQMWSQLQNQGHWEGEIWNRRKNGSLYVEWLTIRAVQDESGQTQQYVALFSDITDRKQREEAVWHRAYHDALTGLPNRSLFRDRLEHAIITAKRSDLHQGLLFIDLDRFKEINDTLGHAAGDELLKQVAERLRNCVRASDTVARLAGDEFMILMEDVPDGAPLSILAEKILAQLNRPFQLYEHMESISASIGAAIYPENGTDIDTLIQSSDHAMYEAKRQGRNTYAFAQATPGGGL